MIFLIEQYKVGLKPRDSLRKRKEPTVKIHHKTQSNQVCLQAATMIFGVKSVMMILISFTTKKKTSGI